MVTNECCQSTRRENKNLSSLQPFTSLQLSKILMTYQNNQYKRKPKITMKPITASRQNIFENLMFYLT